MCVCMYKRAHNMVNICVCLYKKKIFVFMSVLDSPCTWNLASTLGKEEGESTRRKKKYMNRDTDTSIA
jgi:hypothetical protein